MQHLISRNSIESNQAFQKMLDKTQVLTQKFGMEEVIKNRLTHSYEVATSGKIIAKAISTDDFDVDYQKAVFNVCLLHDIGHPPFGHEGSVILDARFKSLGVAEGFSDNNNNFVVIEKNGIEISDYELASLIKYPNKLYASQSKYKKKLEKAIQQDVEFFKDFIKIDKLPQRTLVCEIMDEADHNTYTCADLADCYSMELADTSRLKELKQKCRFKRKDIRDILDIAITVIDIKDKNLIKKVFSEIKLLVNTNYILGDNLALEYKCPELKLFRDELAKISYETYIMSDYTKRKGIEEKEKFLKYVDYVLDNEFYPSKYYAMEIQSAKTSLEKNILIRDMIADTTDNFVKKFCAENNL